LQVIEIIVANGRIWTDNLLITNQEQKDQPFPFLVLTGYVSPPFSSLYKKERSRCLLDLGLIRVEAEI